MKAEEYIKEAIEKVKVKNKGEETFIQAVEEVLTSLTPFIEQNPQYIENNILERIVEPERQIIFKVPWEDDNGKIQVNRGFRVEFNGVLGPYKGGLRFHPSVALDSMKFLSFEQTFKNSLTGLPIGGGKGGSDFNPINKSDREIKRFCESFMNELYRHIGPDKDVPAGDIGVSGKEIGYLFGHYRRLKGAYENGVITGKGFNYGGSRIRPEATGYGVTYFVQEMLKDIGETIVDKKVAVSGYGNVAWGVCKKVTELGGKIVTISEKDGYIYVPEGLTEEQVEYMLYLRSHTELTLKDYADKFNLEYIAGKKPWERKVDIVIPCAIQNELNLDDAKEILANQVKIVCEAANMPCTPEAIELFESNNIPYAPGKAANAGGVAVSALEMSQNSMRYQWTAEEVDAKLHEIMKDIYEKSKEMSEKYNVSLAKGANIAGFKKVADTMIMQGNY
ncbi:NADP-specific glutamate dehydrogenase [Fusobacterium sp.]|uniref:NADP-specific glutamate dehydrogenase n=1 Tax=Fusobacterium sp. TaxID=68766 RepID=UPI001D9CB862|nr:NADP-specific glutamate dehydrogenase [Fusobacterium sp.]MBS5789239.1 NADP-specific glutamate dehydrogenase [Fusobacterium sp.]